MTGAAKKSTPCAVRAEPSFIEFESRAAESEAQAAPHRHQGRGGMILAHHQGVFHFITFGAVERGKARGQGARAESLAGGAGGGFAEPLSAAIVDAPPVVAFPLLALGRAVPDGCVPPAGLARLRKRARDPGGAGKLGDRVDLFSGARGGQRMCGPVARTAGAAGGRTGGVARGFAFSRPPLLSLALAKRQGAWIS